jgi:ADP-ribose pyrophosphatase YjhB (NUDIX family)
MKKIFYGNKIIYFAKLSHKFDKKDMILQIPIKNFKDLKKQFRRFTEDESWQRVVFLFKSNKSIKKLSRKYFIYIEAAGGLVKNEKSEYLIIERNEKWDLPKGKLEENESPKKAAKREVIEETMVIPLKLGKKLINTYHIYKIENRFALKKTHWYKMKAHSDSPTKAQEEEQITQVVWMLADELPQVYAKTFSSLLEVFKRAKLLVED